MTIVSNSRPIVVKIGGAEGVEIEAVCRDAAELIASGRRMILVHGGSAEASRLGEALGHPPRMLRSPSGYTWRYTDRRTLEIFAMAARGKVNTLLVERLQALGVNAFGLSGLDGRLLVASRKAAVQSVEDGRRRVVRDDYTGRVEQVDAHLLHTLLDVGCTPVIAPLAVSPAGEALNVDADRAAAKVAAAMSAELLIFLTAAPGLLRAFPDEASLIDHLPLGNLDEALAIAEGRMKKKILATQEAVAGGVGRVVIADGRIPQPITAALAGQGTRIGEVAA
jgi:acetylglutamate/LysW-gamma-L-alpha-aminoadipate kinase